MDWFADNPWLAWLGIALILAAIEAATVDFVFVMLAGGAAAAAIASAAGASFPLQVVIAVVVAVILLLVVRPVVKKQLMAGDASHSIGARSLVGRSGKVIQTQKATIKVETLVRGLDQPWGAAFLPDGRMIFTERNGNLRFMDKSGRISAPVVTPVSLMTSIPLSSVVVRWMLRPASTVSSVCAPSRLNPLPPSGSR